jgi:pimeloyl-ACP methyl ester carboxylesterase
LHGAALPQRDQPIFDHLARVVTPFGFTVLSFDRRPSTDSPDTSIEVQAGDALLAVAYLRARIDAPVGLFGFSQGAWAASAAASLDPAVAFLVLVGCSGVSPAEQMRYYTDELLRRAGYNDTDRAALQELRTAIEALYRGAGDREEAEHLLSSAVTQPWFELAYLYPELPAATDVWPDMDYEPAPTFAKVFCPTVVMYGSDEECVPAGASKQAWVNATQSSGNSDLTVVDIPDCGHFPAPGADASSLDVQSSSFSAHYTDALQQWFSQR